MTTTAAEPQRPVSAEEARAVAEAAREQEWAAPSFVRDLFLGTLRMDLIRPYPEQDPDEVARAKPFLEKLERFLRQQVDSDQIDRDGEIPEAVIQGLRDLGAFGIKIPREYGGLGLSQLSYMKAIELVSSIDGSITALLSAHQSIGVPGPLKTFGNEAQKQKSGEASENGEDETGPNIEKRVEEFTKAVAPVLLPMINSLGSLDVEPAMASSTAGEAT